MENREVWVEGFHSARKYGRNLKMFEFWLNCQIVYINVKGENGSNQWYITCVLCCLNDLHQNTEILLSAI